MGGHEELVDVFLVHEADEELPKVAPARGRVQVRLRLFDANDVGAEEHRLGDDEIDLGDPKAGEIEREVASLRVWLGKELAEIDLSGAGITHRIEGRTMERRARQESSERLEPVSDLVARIGLCGEHCALQASLSELPQDLVLLVGRQ